jgi:hypothetical protein
MTSGRNDDTTALHEINRQNPTVIAIRRLATDRLYPTEAAMNELHPTSPQPSDAEPEPAPPGTPPHIAVAPGLLDHQHTVIREPGENDESYQSRCELLAVLLDFVQPG